MSHPSPWCLSYFGETVRLGRAKMRAKTRPASHRTVLVFIQALVLLVIMAPAPLIAANGINPTLSDKDFRAGIIKPTAAQVSAVNALGAKVRWNRFGTPQSLIKYSGWLRTGLTGAPEVAARNFIRANKALFRLSD